MTKSSLRSRSAGASLYLGVFDVCNQTHQSDLQLLAEYLALRHGRLWFEAYLVLLIIYANHAHATRDVGYHAWVIGPRGHELLRIVHGHARSIRRLQSWPSCKIKSMK